MALDHLMPVLVVDDTVAIVRIIRTLLKHIRLLEFDEAGDGPAALTKMRSKRYGLVISDWNMETTTGTNSCAQLGPIPT